MDQKIKDVCLSFSCQEKWESFTSKGDHKFCERCKHVVVDFSNLSRAEFDERIKNSQGQLCGRFKKSQMSARFLKYAAASAIVASASIGMTCTPESTEPNIPKTPATESIEPAKERYVLGIVA